MVPGPRRSRSHRGVREVPGRLGVEDDLPREDSVRHFRLQGLVCRRHALGWDESAGRHKHLLRRDSQPPERAATDFRRPGYRARRRRLAGELVRAAGCQEQAHLYDGHPAVGLAAVGQKPLRTRDPSVRGDRRTVQVRAGFCTTVARCSYSNLTLIPKGGFDHEYYYYTRTKVL